MLLLAGSFSYTARVSFSEEFLLHFLCFFVWAVLGTLVFNHACMPDISFSKRHHYPYGSCRMSLEHPVIF